MLNKNSHASKLMDKLSKLDANLSKIDMLLAGVDANKNHDELTPQNEDSKITEDNSSLSQEDVNNADSGFDQSLNNDLHVDGKSSDNYMTAEENSLSFDNHKIDENLTNNNEKFNINAAEEDVDYDSEMLFSLLKQQDDELNKIKHHETKDIKTDDNELENNNQLDSENSVEKITENNAENNFENNIIKQNNQSKQEFKQEKSSNDQQELHDKLQAKLHEKLDNAEDEKISENVKNMHDDMHTKLHDKLESEKEASTKNETSIKNILDKDSTKKDQEIENKLQAETISVNPVKLDDNKEIKNSDKEKKEEKSADEILNEQKMSFIFETLEEEADKQKPNIKVKEKDQIEVKNFTNDQKNKTINKNIDPSRNNLLEISAKLVQIICLPNEKISEIERIIASQSFVRLLPFLNIDEKIELSQRFANQVKLPFILVENLISEDIKIISELVRGNLEIDETILHEYVKSAPIENILALIENRKISPIIIHDLVEKNDEEIALSLLRNKKNSFSAKTLEYIIDYYDLSHQLIINLKNRSEFNFCHALSLYWKVPGNFRESLLLKFSISRNLSQVVLNDLYYKYQDFDDKDEIKKILQLYDRRTSVRDSENCHNIENILFDYYLDDDEEKAKQISKFISISPKLVKLIVDEKYGQAIGVLLKAYNVEREKAYAFIVQLIENGCIEPILNIADKHKQLSPKDVVFRLYEKIPSASAKSIMHYWDWMHRTGKI